MIEGIGRSWLFFCRRAFRFGCTMPLKPARWMIGRSACDHVSNDSLLDVFNLASNRSRCDDAL
jgi:hypothetical protein